MMKAVFPWKKNLIFQWSSRTKQIYHIWGWTVRRSSFFVVIAILGFAALGCSSLESIHPSQTEQAEDFAIYLLPAEYFFKGIGIDHCADLGSKLLGQGDILTYKWSQHDILLQPAVVERIAGLDLTGNPFVICVGDTEVYRGEIMAAYMSRSSDKVVILWPPMDGGTSHISIQLGYPGADFFVGPDPRADERIKAALIAADALRE